MTEVSNDRQTLCEAIRSGDRGALARTITLLESTRSEHLVEGQAVLELLVPHSGTATRVGITGPPGVGKSSLNWRTALPPERWTVRRQKGASVG